MMKQDAVFLITGAALGVGRAATELVVTRGHRVVACDVRAELVAALCRDLGDNAVAVELDIRDSAAWQQAFDRAADAFGRVDVLVNNAAVLHAGLAVEVEWEAVQHTVDVNLLGVIKGIRTAVPRMIGQGGGHIVTVGSFLSHIPMPGLAVYTATKHAVRAFVSSCALELRDQPVGFTLVCPAAIDTPMLEIQIDDDSVPLSFAEEPVPPERVVEAIWRASVDRPAEIMVPSFQGRYLKVAGLYPGLLRRMLPAAEKRGRERQAKLRAARGG
jgi:NAD(P)-dependent dehydrogenase (short-subunit alcohol dehydrogenase family)